MAEKNDKEEIEHHKSVSKRATAQKLGTMRRTSIPDHCKPEQSSSPSFAYPCYFNVKTADGG